MPPPPTLFRRLQRLVERYGSLALPVRLAIGAVVSVAAGAGLGFFAEYAAYSWAIYYGIRPPLEGIPYLKLAVTSLTVAALLGGALLFGLVQAACGYLIRTVERYIQATTWVERIGVRFLPSLAGRNIVTVTVDRLRSLRPATAFLSAALVASLSAIPLVVELQKDPISYARLLPVFAYILLMFIALILAWRPTARSWIALLSVLAFVVIGPFTLFNVHAYSALLRTLGYGGGLSVVVALVEEKSDLNSKTQVRGSLLLRTTSALLIFQPTENRIREIPLSQVIYVDHAVTPVRERRLPLPP